MAGIKVDAWSRDLAKNLFPTNSFSGESKDDSVFVLNDLVYLPQAGAIPNVVRDRSVFPAVAVQRTDVVKTYQMSEFSTDPTHIQYSEALVVSYEKSANVMEDHIAGISDKIHQYIPFGWAPTVATMLVNTTGGLRPASSPGATGNRKKITLTDILSAKRILDIQDVPQEGRCLLMNTESYNDLVADLTTNSSFYNGGATPMVNGNLTNLYGFKIYQRSTVGRYAAGSVTPKDPIAVNAAGDNSFSLAWHPMFVRKAIGSTEVFVNLRQAAYYGDMMSALARFGATKARLDGKGVVAIVEAP